MNPAPARSERLPRVLFAVEGNTDIRLVTLFADVCDLTLLVPAEHYESSGLEDRVRRSGAAVRAEKIPGDRLRYQLASLRWLWRRAGDFEVILAQEMLRGTLNAGLAGRRRRVPVLGYTCMPPLEYFRCRRLRGQPLLPAVLGQAVIRSLLAINGRLVTRCLALGAYLAEVARRTCPNVEVAHYYGVDTDLYRPVPPDERAALRARLGLPADALLVFFASRVSHEKDPETALRAVARVREQGIPAVIINLGGGYREFIELGRALGLPDPGEWVLGRPAEHPMGGLERYFQAADVLLQCSLEEGLGMTPLEALACGTPAIATRVGGLAATLPGHARLVPRRDVEAAVRELAWVHAHPEEARAEALRSRSFVEREHSRQAARRYWASEFLRAAGRPPDDNTLPRVQR